MGGVRSSSGRVCFAEQGGGAHAPLLQLRRALSLCRLGRVPRASPPPPPRPHTHARTGSHARPHARPGRCTPPPRSPTSWSRATCRTSSCLTAGDATPPPPPRVPRRPGSHPTDRPSSATCDGPVADPSCVCHGDVMAMSCHVMSCRSLQLDRVSSYSYRASPCSKRDTASQSTACVMATLPLPVTVARCHLQPSRSARRCCCTRIKPASL